MEFNSTLNYGHTLQKSMPAQPHILKDNAAKMKENLTRKINNETLTGVCC